jgi:8-oxo-dGTP pyrophosphatase MutT (NUDIX family)
MMKSLKAEIHDLIKRAGLTEQEHPDYEHGEALAKTGFWGKQGAGVMPVAQDTGRILLPHRSSEVEQPGDWGATWGGAIDAGLDPQEAARKEFFEEAGYTGSMKMIPLKMFEDSSSGFRYYNFLGVVPSEFKPRLNWETQNYQWVKFGDWPQPMHFGFNTILNDSASVNRIQQVTAAV